MDYNRPAGEIVRLAVVRHRASQPDRRIGSLVVNPGGPGASGVELVTDLAQDVADSTLAQRFDLVGFDPRGVAASVPAIRCFTPRERDADRLDVVVDNSPAGVARQEDAAKNFVAKCVQRSGLQLLANVGARDVARDMDVLRAALGDRQLTYLGYSYGTRLGYTYAEYFPRNVRALILDGAIDPVRDATSMSVTEATGFQRAFNAFAAWCAQQQCPLGIDPARATARFRTLVQPTIGTPVPLADGRKMSYDDVITATHDALYSPEQWERLRRGLSELAGGHGDTLMRLADDYFGRKSDGSYDGSEDAFEAITCVDDKPVTDPAVLAERSRRVLAAAPFEDAGTGPDPARGACGFWPVPATSARAIPHVTGLAQVLVVSVTGDPSTPYQSGVDLAAALNARLLTVQGTQHTATLEGNPCVDGIVDAYLTDLTLPAEGTRCTMGPASAASPR